MSSYPNGAITAAGVVFNNGMNKGIVLKPENGSVQFLDDTDTNSPFLALEWDTDNIISITELRAGTRFRVPVYTASTLPTPTSSREGEIAYTQDTDKLMVCTGAAWVEVTGGGSGSGVTSLNSLTGALSITGDPPFNVVPSGATINLEWTGILSVARGGTGQSSFTSGGVLFGQGSSALAVTANGAANSVLWTSGGGTPEFSTTPTVGTLATTKQAGITLQREASVGPGELRFMENNGGSEYIGFKAPEAITTSVIWTLPATAGSAGQVLSTDASNVLSWVTVGGGAGITSLEGQSGAVQTFGDDTNVTIVSATNNHQITWAGLLSVARGGTGVGTFTSGGLLVGLGTSPIAQVSVGGNNTVLQGIAGTAPVFTGTPTLTTLTTIGQAGIIIDDDGVNVGELRFRELGVGSNYVGFKAATSLSSDIIWQLPTTAGAANQALVTNGSNVLSWATIGGSSEFNVKEYGADSTGSCAAAGANVTAINSAIAAAAAANGGRVYFPHGVYCINAGLATTADAIVFVGDGSSHSVITTSAGPAYDIIKFTSSDRGGVENLQISFGGTQSSGFSAIHAVDSNALRIKDVFIYGAANLLRDGVHIEAVSAPVTGNWLHNVEIVNGLGAGVKLSGASNTNTVVDTWVNNVRIAGATGGTDAVQINSFVMATHLEQLDVFAWGNWGLNVNAAATTTTECGTNRSSCEVWMSNSVIDSTITGAIRLRNTGTIQIVGGNWIKNPGASSTTKAVDADTTVEGLSIVGNIFPFASQGIAISTAADRNLISSNQIFNQKIEILSGAQNSHITSNLSDFSGTFITDAGSNTVIGGNYEDQNDTFYRITNLLASGMSAKLNPWSTVEAYGAVGNGSTNDSAAFQAAIDSLGTTGGTVKLGRGKYVIDSTITIKKGVTLEGVHEWPGAQGTGFTGINYTNQGGTILLNSAATISMESGSAIKGILIYRKGMTFPAPSEASFAGTAITFPSSTTDVKVHNLTILGFQVGVQCGAVDQGRFDLDNLRIDCTYGVVLQSVFDTTVLNRLHIYPFASIDSSPTTTKLRRAGAGVLSFTNCDDCKVTNSLILGHATGIDIDSSNGFQITNVWIDNLSPAQTGSVGIRLGTANAITVNTAKVWHQETGFLFNGSGSTLGNTCIDCQTFDTPTGFKQTGTNAMHLISPVMHSNTTGIVLSQTNAFGTILNPIFRNCTTPMNSTVTTSTSTHHIWNPFLDNAAGTALINTAYITNQIASANPLPLPPTGKHFVVTGTTAFSNMTGNWAAREVCLRFTGTIALLDSGNLKLAGGFTTTNTDTMCFVGDGTDWYELSRRNNG